MLKAQKVTESLYIIGILIISPTADCTNTPFKNCNVIGWNPCFSLGKNMHDNYRPQRSWGKVIFSQASVILSTGGGMRGCWGGCAWLREGMCGCWGACMVARGCVACRECAWLRGMHGCGVACVVAGGACVEHDEIRSMSGWYASYWNAFLF